MEFIIRGDKIKITDAMKSYIEEKLGKLDKYLKNTEEVRAKVIVKSDKKNQRVDKTDKREIRAKRSLLHKRPGDLACAVDGTAGNRDNESD